MRALSLALTLGLAVAAFVPTTSGVNPLIAKKDVYEDYYGVTGGKHLGGSTGTSAFKIEIDDEEINEIIRDFKEFGNRYITKTKAERIALLRKLKEAFRNTAAKMILNFGKTFPPLVSSWANVMKHVQVNEKCDQHCAVKCLDLFAGCENMYFEPRCLSSCHCKFDIDSVDPKVLRGRMDEVTSKLDNVNRFFKGVNVENMRLVKPSFDNYMAKASGLHEEFGELLKYHGSKILGCEEECLEDCLDPRFVSFWQIPMCVKHCKCDEGIINIERMPVGEVNPLYLERASRWGTENEEDEEEEDVLGKEYVHHPLHKEHWTKRRPLHNKNINIPELMKYSDYDHKAWSFFKRVMD